MGDEMKFPNEVWIYDFEGQRWQQKEDASQQRYIHESRVPISCGGTMEDTNDWCRSCFVQNPCGNAIKRRGEAVLTSGNVHCREILENIVDRYDKSRTVSQTDIMDAKQALEGGKP
jgi:hypothetical protein